MVRLLRRAVPVALILALALEVAPAFAHEHVIVGDYEFTVGWLSEPALAGQLNGLELFVAPAPPAGSEGHEGEEQGITGLEDSLIFTVEYGGESRTIPLEPAFGQPGGYQASFLPSQPGQYTFHFTGSVQDQSVDVPVEPEEVGNPADVSFPAASSSSLALQMATVQTIAILGALLGAAGLVLSLMARRRP